MTEPATLTKQEHRALNIMLVALYLFGGALAILILWIVRQGWSMPPVAMISGWRTAVMGVVAVGVAMALFRKFQARWWWEILFTVTLFLGVWFALLLVLPLGWAFAIASLLTFAQIFLRIVIIHDLFYLIGSVGVAINFAGWLPPEVLLVMLVGFTVYDMVAGPPGGPVLQLASQLVSRGIVPGAILVGRPRDLMGSVDAVMKRTSVLLGAGDIILPLTLVARAAFAGSGPATIVLAGVLAGALVLGRSNDLHPRAALPALATGAAVPFLILRLLSLI
jgi:presenilin-like A22 family membrane protease